MCPVLTRVRSGRTLMQTSFCYSTTPCFGDRIFVRNLLQTIFNNCRVFIRSKMNQLCSMQVHGTTWFSWHILLHTIRVLCVAYTELLPISRRHRGHVSQSSRCRSPNSHEVHADQRSNAILRPIHAHQCCQLQNSGILIAMLTVH